MLSREMLDEPARYSRSHCLTSRPSDAESRLHTRLENHNVFKRTANPLALNGATTCGTAGAVELTKFALTVKLLSWMDICERIAVWVSSGCCCSHLYDSILNAVKTAEKRPACYDMTHDISVNCAAVETDNEWRWWIVGRSQTRGGYRFPLSNLGS